MDQRCKIKEWWWMFCSPCAMRSHLYPRRCTTSRSRKWVLPIWTWVWPYDLGIISHYIFTIWYRHLSIRITSCHAYLPRVITITGFHKPMTVDRPRPHQTQILIETCPYLKQDLGLWSLWMFSPNLKSFRHVPMWKIYPNLSSKFCHQKRTVWTTHQGEFEMFDPQLHSSAGQLGMLS